MTKDEVMHLVNETAPRYESWGCEAHFQHFAQRLAVIVSAAERERIAKIFEDDGWPPYDYPEVAAAIRARGGE